MSPRRLLCEVDRPITDFPLLGRCADCGELQYDTPSGPVCCNGHGGAETVRDDQMGYGTGIDLPEAVQPPTDKPFPRMSKDTTVEVRMAPAFAKILEHVFRVDPWKEYTELESSLKIGGRGYTDHDTLMKALDGAEDNARKAHQLYCAARAEQERYEMDAQVIEGVARRTVMRDLEAEKEAGQRKKMITEADVASYIQLLYPDEYDQLRLTRLKLRKLVENMERLADLHVSRCRTLQVMLGKQR
jgi:hypothetical protein